MSPNLELAKLAIAGLSKKDRLSLIGELHPGTDKVLAESKIYWREAVAVRASCSLRTVDAWARQGLLVRVKLPGRSRAAGFTSASVERLLAGGAANEAS